MNRKDCCPWHLHRSRRHQDKGNGPAEFWHDDNLDWGWDCFYCKFPFEFVKAVEKMIGVFKTK